MDFLLDLENGASVPTPSKLIDYALTLRPILSVDSQKSRYGNDGPGSSKETIAIESG